MMVSPPFLFGPESGSLYFITQIGIIIFALILSILTFSAYRNTKIKKLKYILYAFILFIFYGMINLIDAQFVDIMPDDLRFALVSSAIFVILLLLFIGIVKKDHLDHKKTLE
jgi:hypothetical protein